MLARYVHRVWKIGKQLMHLLKAAILCLATAFGSGTAHANLLVNGGFESPTAGAPSTKFANGTLNLVWTGSDGAVEYSRHHSGALLFLLLKEASLARFPITALIR